MGRGRDARTEARGASIRRFREKVTGAEQATAIGLFDARPDGANVPRKVAQEVVAHRMARARRLRSPKSAATSKRADSHRCAERRPPRFDPTTAQRLWRFGWTTHERHEVQDALREKEEKLAEEELAHVLLEAGSEARSTNDQ
jgi:nitroreductase